MSSKSQQSRPSVWTGPLIYGGDYNPEQWPDSVMDTDMRLLTEAGINTLTLNVFSWSLLQPGEDRYDFSTLDRIVDRTSTAGMNIVMGTSTGAVPPWMARRYPDICRVDFAGRRHLHGVRENACLTSVAYQTYAPRLAGRVAQRYLGLDNLICWHVSNEYYGRCYCDSCAQAFRSWLMQRHGDIQAVNEAWASNFWSHTYNDFDEINPPSDISDFENGTASLPGMNLDYIRFHSDLVLDAYRSEKAAIREHDAATPVTTNLMMPFRDYDYASWSDELDVIAWDSYPGVDKPTSRVGMHHDIMRGLKGGEPFLLMEQTPSRQRLTRATKRPGQMRQQSWQAVAHGADAVMFFQMRQSRGGAEQFHGAVISSDGTNRTRVFRSVAQLGDELARVGEKLRGSRVVSDVAIVHDWESWWALDGVGGGEAHPEYHDELFRYYDALSRRGVGVDIVAPKGLRQSYKLVIAPTLFLTSPQTAQQLRSYVAGGGRLVLTSLTGQLDTQGRVQQGEAPVPLRDVAGVWEEEICNMGPGETAGITFSPESPPVPSSCVSEPGPAGEGLCSLLVPDPETEVLARFYGNAYCEGSPAVTRHRHGSGSALYVATLVNKAAASRIIDIALADLDVDTYPVPDGVETMLRLSESGSRYRFFVNGVAEHRSVEVRVPGVELITGKKLSGELTLGPYDVAVLLET